MFESCPFSGVAWAARLLIHMKILLCYTAFLNSVVLPFHYGGSLDFSFGPLGCCLRNKWSDEHRTSSFLQRGTCAFFYKVSRVVAPLSLSSGNGASRTPSVSGWHFSVVGLPLTCPLLLLLQMEAWRVVEVKITRAGTLFLDCSKNRSFTFGVEYADGLRQCLEHFFGLHLRELAGVRISKTISIGTFRGFACSCLCTQAHSQSLLQPSNFSPSLRNSTFHFFQINL